MAVSASPSYRHRKRTKPELEDHRANDRDTLTTRRAVDEPTFALAAFLWPARRGVSRWAVLPLVLIVCGLYRWTAGFWPYSGFRAPPMHGDFEAQRHWMEITLHLPITQWYFHDLEWWGLDYPPLTAYHSWLLGRIGSIINPSWFALHTSRGLDDLDLKTYMRATVLISEFLVYVPALVFFVRRVSQLHRVNKWESSIALIAILMQPGTILIDHAHFQYNTVMLGFVVASLSSVLAGNSMWACVFFVAALGFKQMTLYYAPAMFAYLLGSCISPRLNVGRLLGIALATIVSFAVLVAPLILGTLLDQYRGRSNKDLPAPPLLESSNIMSDEIYYPILLQLAQATHRIFPFARGLFEDKVANFWCAVHTFYKLRQFDTAFLQRLSLAATATSILPPCLAIGIFPDRTLLPTAMATTAWGFFMFSFQVHEKSVLLPLLSMTLLLAERDGLSLERRAWIGWANILGCWTMFPLLKRDGLRIPYFVLTLLWAWLMGEPSVLALKWREKGNELPRSTLLSSLLHTSFYVAMVAWHIVEAFVPPPENKPDLWVVANVLVGATGFSICYLWCLGTLLQACLERSSWWNSKKSGLHGRIAKAQ